ncbi:Zinc finger and BTB domain-containing protein 16 [Aphelenchoides besseyi]|nr:Zinc finger and BTB domain-containing protein 16 [Aphelenchoides besseyi]KAI6193828.1 Zinc finger and BTB domain-containing protein 16 [Aphelenchoides besseyi]
MLFEGNQMEEFKVPMFRARSPDYEDLLAMLNDARQAEELERVERQKSNTENGVGMTLKRIKNPELFERPRIALDESGAVINGTTKKINNVASAPRPVPVVLQPRSADDLTGAVARPTKPSEIRRLVRAKMVRCKRCRNRFLDKHIYERHLRDKHPVDHIAYLVQQEEEMQQQRREELEQNRLDEIASGGFIPPAKDMESQNFEVDVDTIPLPGELTNGVAARFDRFGSLYQPKRVYKKKVSPQCPFCDKRYRNEHSLKKHISKKHPENAEFVQCLKCFKALKDDEELRNHLCEMLYMCFECTPIRNLCTESRLSTHRAKFHRGANSGFKCNLCNQKFLTPRKLRKHKKMSHVFTKTYPCHFCDELFTSETSVTTHERIHTGIIKFECKICDFKCNRFLNMEEHRKEEHGYICSICRCKLAEWSDIKNHTLNEHGGYLTSEHNSGYIECPRVWVMFKGE